MKKLYYAFLLTTLSLHGQTQTLKLSISNPQPRIGDEFELTLNIKDLKSEIFKSVSNKVQIVSENTTSGKGDMKINVIAIKKGINELGPLILSLNGISYTTNKVSFEVVDSLPNVDEGLWFRKITKTDSTFSIIIEQRIPANEKTTHTSENSVTYTTEPETSEYVKLKDSFSVSGLSSDGSSISTDFTTIAAGIQEKRFMRCFSVYNFVIDDKKQKIVITKDLFNDLPKTYNFKEIKVQ